MAKKKTKKVDKKKKLELSRLAWQIIGAKFLYYEGAKHNLSQNLVPSDAEYDAWEDSYKKLCKELKVKPTASEMVGFDSSRPSCKMVMQHLLATKGKCPIKFKGVSEKAKSNTVQEVRKKVNVYHEQLVEVLEELGVDEKIAKKIKIKMKKRMKP